MAFFGILMALYLITIIWQPLIPPIELLHGARLILGPLFVCYVGLAFELPYVLGFAFFAGFLWDLMTVQFITRESGLVVEILMGWSIILYGLVGLLAHGLRPIFINGRWQVLILLAGFTATLIPIVEFLAISLARFDESQEFVFPSWLWYKILGQGAICGVLSIPFYYVCKLLAGIVRYDPSPEELRTRS